MNPFGVIVLAAGGSSRLGSPKQLLDYQGRTLIEHAAQTALMSRASEVVVVVGAHADEVRAAISDLPVQIALNADWPNGMASSIHAGMTAIGGQRVLITLVDHPLVTPEHLKRLANKQAETGARIVATAFGGVLGVPAIFSPVMFPHLLALIGDKGARDLIRAEATEWIDFEDAAIDVDTASDASKL